MSSYPKSLAIIPARGGSKGVPRKNCIDIGGRPLIAYTIDAARACSRFDRVVVSTDDVEIADISRQYGAEVPVLRPKALAGDKSSLSAVFEHMHAVLAEQGYIPEIVAYMYPTHPFRSVETLRGLMDKLAEGYGRVFVGKPVAVAPDTYFTVGEGGALSSARLVAWPEGVPCFRPYGLFDGVRRSGGNLGTYVHRVENLISLIDIDDPEDLELARYVVAHNLWSMR